MDVFDAICRTVSSAGGRRGAQMACIEISHPDVEAFITAKREAGRLRAFNLSVLITDAFVDAVRRDADWPLVFPAFRHELGTQPLLWPPWPARDPNFNVHSRAATDCIVSRMVPAPASRDLVFRT